MGWGLLQARILHCYYLLITFNALYLLFKKANYFLFWEALTAPRDVKATRVGLWDRLLGLVRCRGTGMFGVGGYIAFPLLRLQSQSLHLLIERRGSLRLPPSRTHTHGATTLWKGWIQTSSFTELPGNQPLWVIGGFQGSITLFCHNHSGPFPVTELQREDIANGY